MEHPLLKFLRFWCLPLVSLVATILFPATSQPLWLLWFVTFLGLLEGGNPVTTLRPAFWVGLHLSVLFLF